ncbi:hypothetical protein H0G69_00410 [Limosilactobacillus mucosae]|uniref:hypothetical protein n=1 Tax=Limosilactobacillus mucosae TaxID=97478 RepID=UPI0015D56BE6|nr:hypothetical protein [Limosilactobacillus mucosae]QLI93587.1 hypothetical protein H0G69_00410 [Limosilactobacillus mucosae]
MEYPSFSVLITVYSKEDPEFLNQAIRSVIKQTVVPDQIIVVEKGVQNCLCKLKGGIEKGKALSV